MTCEAHTNIAAEIEDFSWNIWKYFLVQTAGEAGRVRVRVGVV